MKGFLLGVGIGIGMGILFAPEEGEASRRKLKQYARDAINELSAEFSNPAKENEFDDNNATRGATRTSDSQI
jgi:gas vesicle protein